MSKKKKDLVKNSRCALGHGEEGRENISFSKPRNPHAKPGRMACKREKEIGDEKNVLGGRNFDRIMSWVLPVFISTKLLVQNVQKSHKESSRNHS